ncbi:MAG TPA: sigma-54 dependent transcriptional regulator [Candidatus Macondimonas sp.]|nr:sigma-54 dependent transcriptional regulator [Candidatus Macondimonas sp.]
MADPPANLLLKLWIEVGRHQRVVESMPVFIDALREAMPLRRVQIDEFRSDTEGFTPLLVWPDRDVPSPPQALLQDPVQARPIAAWAARREVALADPDAGWRTPFQQIPGLPAARGAMAAPLWFENALIGLVLIERGDFAPVGTAAQARLQALLDPLAAAVANDRRLRELERLKAAAEADRQMLLSRLGRSSLSETIVGADHGLRGVMARVVQVAPTHATVLILGETGAGKEVVARAIHERSTRAKGPFVRVNCGAVPPDLIDSELFGHEKGSFTGALAARRGWFERADGGTLFLDEIGELTPAVQIRLLRVLQDGIVQRVGSEREIPVDVRVIAATHRDLPGLVQDGVFREDLWYRLAVFPVILPPLRERPEDIPLLAAHFVHRAAARLGVPTPALTARDLDALLAYRWPGNVRELGAVLERAVILGGGERLDLETALGVGIARQPSPPSLVESLPAMPIPPRASGDAVAPLDSVIAEHLAHVLHLTGGRIDGPHGAARLLRVNASTLRAKLRKHGLLPADYRRPSKQPR